MLELCIRSRGRGGGHECDRDCRGASARAGAVVIVTRVVVTS